jgi:hypothetical protein
MPDTGKMPVPRRMFTSIFDFFRWTLSLIATIYATVITLQSLWGWWVWLAGSDRYVSLLRRYLIVHGLRLRFTAFWGDVLISLLLCVVFLITWSLHGLIRRGAL